MDILKQLTEELGVRHEQVEAAVKLIDEGNTILSLDGMGGTNPPVQPSLLPLQSVILIHPSAFPAPIKAWR